MLPASNSGVGMNMGFPDVCVTPVGPVPVPIPYPNMALNATAEPFAEDVLVSFVPALNMGSEIPMTLGDEAGTESPNSGPGRYTMGNPVVSVNGLPAINLTCPTTGNDMINPIGAVLVPSITNVFFTQASTPDGAPAPGPVDGASLSRLSRSLRELDVFHRPCPPRVACIVVPVFSSRVPARVHAMLRGPLDALLIDLRGCPGGELTAALDLAGDFVEEGCVLAVATDDDGDETVHRARGGALYAFPLYVLVDERTASAAEVFAGALQAHGRAVIVGERTHGKGSAQAIVSSAISGTERRSAGYVTVATFTLPGAVPIEGHGVTPDLLAEDAFAAALGSLRGATST